MSDYGFSSVFAPHLEGFMRIRSSMGIKEDTTIYVLRELDETCVQMKIEEAILTREIIMEWRKDRLNDSEATLYRKWSGIRWFSTYMCNCGMPGYIPKLPRYKLSSFIPRIFTREEVKRIFHAVDSLRLGQRSSTSCLFSMPALFRTLYVTGMRISEAVNLKNEDVDIAGRLITIRKSKNQRQRLIPISPSLVDILMQYLQYRNRMPINGVSSEAAPFFVSHNGRPISKSVAYGYFRKVLNLCGIPYIGGHKGPRMHDIRHTMAVHSLMMMVSGGMDMYCALPILSTLMGHKKISSTEYYVRLTKEMFPDLNMRVSELSSYVFPTLQSVNTE